MTRLSQTDVRNALLRGIRSDDYDLLQRDLARVYLPVGTSLGRLGTPIEKVSFPEDGVCALVVPAGIKERLALGMIGREGVVGVSTLLGARVWQHEILLRGCDATFLQIDAGALREACARSPRLHGLLLRFVGCLLMQISRSSVTNLCEPVQRRLARWILLYHDRLDGDEIAMTHEEMGIMLGVRRATATDALHQLEGSGAIRGVRSRIVVRSRAQLEAEAGSAYGDAEAEYRHLIGPFGKQAGPPLRAT